MVGAGGAGFEISVLGVTVRQTAESHVPGGSGLVCSWCVENISVMKGQGMARPGSGAGIGFGWA